MFVGISFYRGFKYNSVMSKSFNQGHGNRSLEYLASTLEGN